MRDLRTKRDPSGKRDPERRLDRTLQSTATNQVIQKLTEADNITEVVGVQRMTAPGQHYRIRVGSYRLGITMDGETAVLRRFLPRGEIYQRFP